MPTFMWPIIGSVSAVVFWTVLITLIVKGVKRSRRKRRTCPQCHLYYFYEDDIKLDIGDLKWETRGSENPVTVFYRNVSFNYVCSKCGHIRTESKKFDVYSSNATHSQNDEEEARLLQNKIEAFLGDEAFNRELNTQKNKEIQATVSENKNIAE